VSHVFLDGRDGGVRLYLHGDLQFDSRDEHLYHEPLGLVPVALAAARVPRRDLRVLILGGGDGLLLRDVLRSPRVAEAHLVDRDPEVLRLGAGQLAALNHHAFRDARVRVHAADARAFLAGARDFDALVYDLTYPASLEAAALFSVAAFRDARAALRPEGVLALNAVSPELTPQAFGCIGATLGLAGLAALAYGFTLPSFQDEGYGRWGFFYASARPVARDELRRLALPAGTTVTVDALQAGFRLPVAAGPLVRVAPNHTDELLYHLCNATPLDWAPPWRTLRFAASAARRGPRITVAHGFARWLRGPAGLRSVDALLACLPLSRQGQTREALLEWSHQAEVLFREVDLRAFVEQALRRAAELPRAWVRELRALRDRLRDGLPPMDELLHHAYRVFAIYLLVLLLANLLFPDNLYAKGSSSSSSSRSSWSSSSSSSDSGPFHGFLLTDPAVRPGPFRYRPAAGFYAPGGARSRVYDRDGKEYPAQQIALAGPGGRPVSSLLALSPELQLLETGALTYAATLAGYHFLLEPGHLRVRDAAGAEVTCLAPPPPLQADARQQLDAQLPLIDKALADHQRWLAWVGWAKTIGPGQTAVSELAELQAIKTAVVSAQGSWRGPAPAAVLVARDPRWVQLLPGLYLEPSPLAAQEPMLVRITCDGQVTRRPVGPPDTLTPEDRFVFRLLHKRYAEGNDQSLALPVARWIQVHGSALGVPSA
jgi:spermidine synthase